MINQISMKDHWYSIDFDQFGTRPGPVSHYHVSDTVYLGHFALNISF